jgi:hypothetical protein
MNFLALDPSGEKSPLEWLELEHSERLPAWDGLERDSVTTRHLCGLCAWNIFCPLKAASSSHGICKPSLACHTVCAVQIYTVSPSDRSSTSLAKLFHCVSINWYPVLSASRSCVLRRWGCSRWSSASCGAIILEVNFFFYGEAPQFAPPIALKWRLSSSFGWVSFCFGWVRLGLGPGCVRVDFAPVIFDFSLINRTTLFFLVNEKGKTFFRLKKK